MMLTDRITLSGPEETSPEDFFASSLAVIFPDDITNQHGDSTHQVIYTSPRLGEICLSVADPDKSNVSLFSHFLWNAGVQLAALIEEGGEWMPGSEETRGIVEGEAKVGDEKEGHDQGLGGSCGLEPYMEELLSAQTQGKEYGAGIKRYFGQKGMWDVEGKRVLELGAGTGLSGIMAARCGARETVITDYPAPEVLANINVNINANVQGKKFEGEEISCRAQGHIWGQVETTDPPSTIDGDTTPSSPDAFTLNNKESFDTLLVADCLWMPWQHRNLMKSIRWFMAAEGRAWVIAGFHTGRAKMQGFYDDEVLAEEGLEIEWVWERNAEGAERGWVRDRGFEDVTARKRWLVIGVLKRRE